MRPVVDIMFGDFLTLAMDQLANQAAKVHYMSGGALHVPMVLRTTLGATRRSAAQHSQSLHAWVSHIPGLKVALPATPYDAKGLLKAAIRDDNPVVFFEDKLAYATARARAGGGVRDPARASRTSSGRAATSRSWPRAAWSTSRSRPPSCWPRRASAPRSSTRAPRPARCRDADRVRAQDGPRARGRRGPPELRRVGRARRGDRRGRVPLPRRSGHAPRRDGRARAVLAACSRT